MGCPPLPRSFEGGSDHRALRRAMVVFMPAGGSEDGEVIVGDRRVYESSPPGGDGRLELWWAAGYWMVGEEIARVRPSKTSAQKVLMRCLSEAPFPQRATSVWAVQQLGRKWVDTEVKCVEVKVDDQEEELEEEVEVEEEEEVRVDDQEELEEELEEVKKEEESPKVKEEGSPKVKEEESPKVKEEVASEDDEFDASILDEDEHDEEAQRTRRWNRALGEVNALLGECA